MGFLKSTCDHLHIPAAALLVSLGPPATALAHAELVSATPAAKSMAMPPPTELRLKFSEGIELKFTKVKVTGPGKKVIETGPAKLDPGDNTVLIVPLSVPLADGKYIVDWQAVSVDSHKTKGSYGFDSMK
jgi:methionine-rich copper-binding protein CopC